MASRRVEIGPVGDTVAANVSRYRKRGGFSMRGLAEAMEERGEWTLSASAISQIENGHRRVDVDDLFALAITLDVTPSVLLMPEASSGGQTVPSAFGETAASHVWAYLQLPPPAGDPIHTWWESPDESPLRHLAKYFLSLAEAPERAERVTRLIEDFVRDVQETSDGDD